MLKKDYLPWNHQAVKNKFFFTASMVGMLSGVALGVTDGSDVDYGQEWNPYVTLRGGWLFGGKTKYNYHWVGHDTAVPPQPDGEESVGNGKNFGSAWSGSSEVGVSLCEERVSVGLELGYFSGTGKTAFTGGRLSDYSFVGVCYMDTLAGTAGQTGSTKIFLPPLT